MTKRRTIEPQLAFPARCPTCNGTGELPVLDSQGLRSWRKARRLTLRELGRRAGLSASFLCDIEHGRRLATPETLNRIARALGLPALYPTKQR